MESSPRHAAPEASPQEPASTAAAAEALCSMHPAAPPSSSATGAAASGHHRCGLDAAGTRPDPLCLSSPSKSSSAAAAASQRRSGRQAAARGQHGSNAGGGPSSSRGAAAEASEAAASLEDTAVCKVYAMAPQLTGELQLVTDVLVVRCVLRRSCQWAGNEVRGFLERERSDDGSAMYSLSYAR